MAVISPQISENRKRPLPQYYPQGGLEAALCLFSGYLISHASASFGAASPSTHQVLEPQSWLLRKTRTSQVRISLDKMTLQ